MLCDLFLDFPNIVMFHGIFNCSTKTCLPTNKTCYETVWLIYDFQTCLFCKINCLMLCSVNKVLTHFAISSWFPSLFLLVCVVKFAVWLTALDNTLWYQDTWIERNQGLCQVKKIIHVFIAQATSDIDSQFCKDSIFVVISYLKNKYFWSGPSNQVNYLDAKMPPAMEVFD